jgi:transcription initiation factor TFIID TATA-box-binding protein
MREPTYRIENIVATVDLGVGLDLNAIARRSPASEYNPDQFPGLIIRLPTKAALLLFKTGKVVIAGAKSEKELKRTVGELRKILRSAGVNDPPRLEVKIQNVVASCDMHTEVDIEKAALTLDNTLYDPEQFPGLIYVVGKTTFLIFRTGRCVCAGVKSEDELRHAITNTYNALKAIGALLNSTPP